MADANWEAMLVILMIRDYVIAQVAALLADNSAQPDQAQRHLMRRNQGLLKFVEQDYKGTIHSCSFTMTGPGSCICAATPAS